MVYITLIKDDFLVYLVCKLILFHLIKLVLISFFSKYHHDRYIYTVKLCSCNPKGTTSNNNIKPLFQFWDDINI